MSEFINNNQQRLKDLTDFAHGLLQSNDGRRLFDKHKGTIEVTQDVTGIRNLQGERRLLDWAD